GDILVFLSGEREITDAIEALKHKHLPNTELLPLYARLTSATQMKIFKPGDNRRIIFSTNVAETSLTVPRIHYVIDSGVARISRYSSRSKIQGLQIESIAQDSANQRMGRCGRIAEGHCFRLFSQTDFESRPEHSDPEILRTSLASVILQTHVLKLGHLSEFPFIDPPDYKMISDGYQLLFELQAIDEGNQLTQVGTKMAYLPIDVQLARIIIKASQYGCLREVLIIVSALSSQDPRERPLEWSQAADKAHQKFADDESDFMALLLLWDYLNDNKNKKTNKEFRKMCRDQFLSIKRFMEWRDIHRQLSGLVKNQKMQLTSQKSSYEMIHKALLAGFISHIGTIQTNHEYAGTRNKKFMIFPGSGLFNTSPKWLFVASIVHTSRVFGRTVAQVDAKWVEEVGKHLLKENYYEPYWSKKQGSVMGYKKTLILGLTLTDKQQFHYGPIDQTKSRHIFIEKALVEHQLNTRLGFYQHNIRMVAEIHAEEDRHRKKDLMIDQGRYYDLYDAKIPEGIYSESQLKKWISQHGDENLRFTEEDFYRRGAQLPKEKLFPENLTIRQLPLKLNYQFQPGSEEDGVTVDLPLHWLNAVDANDFEFLVPGLLHEKIQTLIKGLPKTIRRGLIPISEYAEILADKLDHSQEFYSQLVRHVMQINGLKTELEDWQKVNLPLHLKMRFKVLDKNHKTLVLNRDFQSIQNRFSQKANISFQKTASTNHKINGAKDWVFAKISKQVLLPSGLPAYSAIIDQGDCVGLRLYETEQQACEIHVQGLSKLLHLKYPKIFKQAKTCPIDIKAEFAWQTLETETRLIDELMVALTEKTIKKQGFINEQTAFDELADQLKKQLYKQCYDWSQSLGPILIQWHKLWLLIEAKRALISEESIEDMNYQLDYLIYTDFLHHLEFADLQHYPRFLDGLAKRIETAIHSPEKELEKLQQLQVASADFYQLCEQSEIFTPAMQDYLILLEELRISLFAQQLGTKQKVSGKRLKAAFQHLP
ncbi:MAG: ATP-dependent RNA helicase HrpA, partial [Proteobacteria bacterium]|nr:ATP-dependent RNA helicase HrpA [Pseudomonadota bacterium]